MTTVLCKHNQRYHHKSRSTRYLQYFGDVVLSYIVATPTSGLCVLNFGVSNGLQRKLEVGWGKAFPGYLQYFRTQPRFYSVFAVLSHTTPNTSDQQKPKQLPLAKVRALGVMVNPLCGRAGSAEL